MIRKSVCVLFCLFFASMLFSLAPMPRVLSQAKLDRFIADYVNVNESGIVKAEWAKAFEQSNATLYSDPEVAADLTAPLSMSYLVMAKAAAQVKKSNVAKLELAKYKWTDEYWDIWVVILFSTQYSQIIEVYAHSGQIVRDGEEDQVGMKPVQDYIDKQDYELVKKNFERIQKAFEADESRGRVSVG